MTPRPLTVPPAQAALHNVKPSPVRLAPPSAIIPDRQYVEQPAPEVSEMAGKKKKKTRKTFDAAFKAKVVARALAAQKSGGESVRDIGRDIGVTDASVYQWIKAAKGQANGAAEPADKAPVFDGLDLILDILDLCERAKKGLSRSQRVRLKAALNERL